MQLWRGIGWINAVDLQQAALGPGKKTLHKMITLHVRDNLFKITPVTQDNLAAVLQVYQQCEDFLALGPVATASMEMVLQDIELSKNEDGTFCGIYTADGKMIGVVDYVSRNYQGEPQAAYLSLLMIAAPYRNQGSGKRLLMQWKMRSDKTRK